MIRIFLYTCALCVLFTGSGYAVEKVIWRGLVNSNGTPSNPVTLNLHRKYQIKVSGVMNLGKWIQKKEELANDACFEFNKEGSVAKVESLKNSLNISVCNDSYHPDHVYISKPFIAEQNRLHFWVYDSDYDDNSGAFQVQIIEVQ